MNPRAAASEAADHKLRAGVWTILCMVIVTGAVFLVPVATRNTSIWSSKGIASGILGVLGLLVFLTATMALVLFVIAAIEAFRRHAAPALWSQSLALSSTVLATFCGMLMTTFPGARLVQPLLIAFSIFAIMAAALSLGLVGYSLFSSRHIKAPLSAMAAALILQGALAIGTVAAATPTQSRVLGDTYSALIGSVNFPSFLGVPGNNSSSTAPAPADCKITSAGNNRFYRVDSTSNMPCYSHWTITGSYGSRDCGFYNSSGGPFTFPANVWNIAWWEDNPGEEVASLDDGTILGFRCLINLRNFPQTTLNRLNWS